MKNIPTPEEFAAYAYDKIQFIGDDPKKYTEWVALKYMSWEANDWQKCVKGKDIPIKNWKATLVRCLPYREWNKVRSVKVNDPKVVHMTPVEKFKQSNGI